MISKAILAEILAEYLEQPTLAKFDPEKLSHWITHQYAATVLSDDTRSPSHLVAALLVIEDYLMEKAPSASIACYPVAGVLYVILQYEGHPVMNGVSLSEHHKLESSLVSLAKKLLG